MNPSYFRLPRNEIVLAIKISTILFVTLVIFHQDIVILTNEALQSELMTHILVIPFLLIYLIYRKRKMLRVVISSETSKRLKKLTYPPELFGVPLCLIAFLLYWHGSYTFTPLEYHILTLPIFVAGLTLIMFNTQTLRQLAFPIMFLFFLTPPPLQIMYMAGAALSTFSSQFAYGILKILGLPVILTQSGIPAITLLKTGSSQLTFAVDTACSGLYSLIGFLIFAVFITYIARGKTWKSATVFFIGFPLIFALNILRITIVVLIGNYTGMELAMQAFHVLGGWFLIFLGTVLLLIISEKLFHIKLFTRKRTTTACSKCSKSQKRNENFCFACGKFLRNIDVKLRKQDIGKIAALLICVTFLISIQVPVFALTEGPVEIIVQSPTGEQQAPTTEILPEIKGYVLEFIHRDKYSEQETIQDASLTYAYFPDTNESEGAIWVFVEITQSKSTLHDWEVCLITWPQTHGEEVKVAQLDLRDVQLIENPPIIARYFAFQHKKTNVTEVVLYWYENALFQTNSTSLQEYVKISLIAYCDNPEDIPATEEKLLPFAKAIANYWQPIKTWSQIALALSHNGPILIATTTALFLTILVFVMIKNYEQKKAKVEAYKKLSETNQKIIETVHSAQKNKPTTNEIAAFYKHHTQKHITLQTLIDKLNQAKETGLLRQEITSREDEPFLTWKSEISFQH